MMFYRFPHLVLTIFLLSLSGVVVCMAESDCAAGEGECANPEMASDAVVDETPPETTEEATPQRQAAEDATPEDPNCPSRPSIIRCAEKHLDTNKNGKLERVELQTAIDKLPWYARGVLQILGSVDKIMKKCDIDGDDAISIGYDMENSKDQCLATCFKRRAFKGAFFPDCE